MRPADAYRLKYRSSSQNSMETETNETAEARVVDELRALEVDEIARAARERERRAAYMRLPPPHKLEELGLSDSGGPGLPVDVFKKLFYEGDKDAVVAWFDATGPRNINENFTLTEPHLAKRVGAEPVSGHTLLALVAHAPAYYSGHVALVRWLLACGADPKIRNADGWSPLDFACTSHEVMYSPSYNFTPNKHEIIMLLIAGGAEVNALIPSKYYPDDPTAKRYSPLGELLTLMWGRNSSDTQFRGLEFVCRALLRAGASLDNCTNERTIIGTSRRRVEIRQGSLRNATTRRLAKVQYFGPRGESGRRRIVCLRPVELRAFVHEQQRRIQGVLRAAAKADPRSPGAGAQGTREDVERRPRIRVWSAKRRRLERPLVLAVLLQDQNPEQ